MVNKNSQKIFNNSLLYALGTVASKAVGFFLVPIYTYNMSSEEYGIATTIVSFVSTFGIVVMLSLRAAMMRFYNDYDEEKKKRFVGTIVTGVSINAAVICILLIVLNKLYMPLLFKGIDFFPCVFWGVLSLCTEGIYLVYQSLLQARQDGKNYSINSIVYLFFHAATVVVFVLLLKKGAEGMVLSNFVTNACFAVYGVMSMCRKKDIVFCFEPKIMWHSLKYSLPILPHNLSNHLNTYSIKLIINHFLTYALSGLYTLASQFATIVNLVQASVNLAFRPWFIEQMQNGEEGRKQIKEMSCMIMSLFSFCAVAVALFSKEIIFIMADPGYFDAWKMVPLFIMTQLISFIYYSHVQSIMYNLKTSKFVVVCSFSGLAVNVVVSLLLVGPLNIYGILIGQIVSKIALSVVAVIMSNKAEKVDFGLRYMIIYLVIAAVLMCGGMLISLFSSAVSIIAILLKIVVLAIAFLIYILRYRNEYVTLLGGMLRRKKKSI